MHGMKLGLPFRIGLRKRRSTHFIGFAYIHISTDTLFLIIYIYINTPSIFLIIEEFSNYDDEYLDTPNMHKERKHWRFAAVCVSVYGLALSAGTCAQDVRLTLVADVPSTTQANTKYWKEKCKDIPDDATSLLLPWAVFVITLSPLMELHIARCYDHTTSTCGVQMG